MWKLPSWIYYLSVSEIFSTLVYALSVNFLESLVLVAAPLVLAFIFPAKWFRDEFVAVGGILVIVFGGFMIYFTRLASSLDAFSYSPVWQALAFMGLAPILAKVMSRIRFVTSFVVGFADRAKIFLYPLILGSLISVLIVFFRNTF